MITTIYQNGQEITVKAGAHVDDIIVVDGKKYIVVKQKNPSYDSYYTRGNASIEYLWGFEEVDE